jgi:hypothetical protein
MTHKMFCAAIADVKVLKIKKIRVAQLKMPSVSIVFHGSVVCRHCRTNNFTQNY